MKVSELEGAALDMWVEAAERGEKPLVSAVTWAAENDYGVAFSTDWAQGGPIIERENICITRWRGEDGYQAYADAYNSNDGVEGANFEICLEGVGPTMLVAAMRCFVSAKFGETVDDES